MITKHYNRLIAIFAALVLVVSLGACKKTTDTMDSPDGPGTTTSKPTDPTGGGPDNESKATGGAGTTTSDPSTEPATEKPLNSTDPTGGGPDNLDSPKGTAPAEEVIEEDTVIVEPEGGGPVEQNQMDEEDAGSVQDDNLVDPTLP